MVMNAGKRDRRIVFQRAGATRSALGTKLPGAWADLGARFASVRFGSSAERREAGAAAGVEAAAQTATFRTLADALTRTVLVTDRITYGGLNYDITGIAPIGRGPTELEFTGVANRG